MTFKEIIAQDKIVLWISLLNGASMQDDETYLEELKQKKGDDITIIKVDVDKTGQRQPYKIQGT